MTEFIIGIISIIFAIVFGISFTRWRMADDKKIYDKEKARIDAYLAKNKKKDESPLRRGYIRVHSRRDFGFDKEGMLWDDHFVQVSMPVHDVVEDIHVSKIVDYYPSKFDENITFIRLPDIYRERWGRMPGHWEEEGIWVIEDCDTIAKKIAEARV